MRTHRKNFVKAKVNIHITPGEMLKTLRDLQGITQGAPARMTGISQSNLSALESNARQLGRERALVLARVLHVHPAVLLFPDYDMSLVA